MNYIDKKLKEMQKYLPSKKGEEYDKRKTLWTKQIIEKGWADYETWSLDSFLSPYILDRLKIFKNKNNGYPGGLTEEAWNEIIDRMIRAFEIMSNDEKYWGIEEKELKEIEVGLELFAKYYRNLWW